MNSVPRPGQAHTSHKRAETAAVMEREEAPGAVTALPGPTWRRTVVRVAVLYTAVTVVSSGYALAAGRLTDTHAHLLLRLGFVIVGIGAVDLYDLMRQRWPHRRQWVLVAAAYLAGVAAIMFGMWLWGATGGDLHPDALRDGFLNFTGVGVVLVMIIAVIDRVRRGPIRTDGAYDSTNPERASAAVSASVGHGARERSSPREGER